MVGNGVTTFAQDYPITPGYPATVANFQVVPMSLWHEFEKEGCGQVLPEELSVKCRALELRMNQLSKDLNYYDLYRPNIPGSLLSNRRGETVIDGEKREYKRGYTRAEYTPFAKFVSKDSNESN